MAQPDNNAPGAPGIEARWTSSAKSGVGTALNVASRVWFTLSHGILDEIYFKRVDWACTRDMGLLITDGRDFFSEEKRDTVSKVETVAPGVPAYRLTNSDGSGRYRIEKEIITDPSRHVVLQRTRFVPLKGKLSDYHVYVLLAPHLGNQGADNTAWLGDFKGTSMLAAQRDDNALALACSVPWLKRSVGFVGTSDGWQDVSAHKEMAWHYELAEHGNVALTGEIDLAAREGRFVLALGFGNRFAEAGHQARASLFDGFDKALAEYVAEWEAFQKSLLQLEDSGDTTDAYRISTAVLRTHEAKDFAGGTIASLSIPWGFSKGDNDLGGYHLVWTRDLVETAGGMVAAGAEGEAERALRYLQVNQEPDGHWTQNMWLDGTPYWTGKQLDEVGFPIMLAEMAWREGILNTDQVVDYWPMVRAAAGYVACNGPVTQQDRWEEDAGYSVFTLAVEIASLLAAAELADLVKEAKLARYLRETADTWNDSIERWTYVKGTAWNDTYGVDGYYVRIAPPDVGSGASIYEDFVPIKNRPPGDDSRAAALLASPDALALVRYGLRAADDPRILNTIKVIDGVLKVETPNGPAWHRYNDDGYGEHEDGSPFDGTGIGRAWPLLTGERAHYELAAGRRREAERLMRTMENFANEGGMIPEQIWDGEDMPERELACGRPSGSAMPLVWAHAEYIKLRRSLREGRIFDMPPQPVQRYLVEKTQSRHFSWRFNQKTRTMPAGKILRIETLKPARVHWYTDAKPDAPQDHETKDTGLGVHVADLPTTRLKAETALRFTFYWPDEDRWEGTEYTVILKKEQDEETGKGANKVRHK